MEAAAAARRLAATAELVGRHAIGPTDRAYWSCDNWDAIAAEVAAAQHISRSMASGQMYLAVALRDRVPQVAALFADGKISARLAATIVWRTDLTKVPETQRVVDATLAEYAAHFGPMSVNRTAQAIDDVIDPYDPGALRRTRGSARGRDVVIPRRTTSQAQRICGAPCSRPTRPFWTGGWTAMAQRIARCGPSNIATKPSPEEFTSRPRNRASSDRTTASCASSSACQPRSPISAARRVESTMSADAGHSRACITRWADDTVLAWPATTGRWRFRIRLPQRTLTSGPSRTTR